MSSRSHKKVGSRKRRSFGLGRSLGDLLLAASNLRAQKLRSFLTAMGIIFGVGSVTGFRSGMTEFRSLRDREETC